MQYFHLKLRMGYCVANRRFLLRVDTHLALIDRDVLFARISIKYLRRHDTARLRAGEPGTRWRSWLKHRAASRNVAGSIPDGVIGIFPVALWP